MMSSPTIVLNTSLTPDGTLHTLSLIRLYGASSLCRRYVVHKPSDERDVLRQFSRAVSNNQYRLAGWKSREQITRAIVRRAFAHGIDFSWYYQDRFGPRYRYADASHLDLFDLLTEYGVFQDSMSTVQDAWSLAGGVHVTQHADMKVLYDTFLAAVLTLRANVLCGKHAPEVYNSELQGLRISVQSCLDNPTAGPLDALGILKGDDYSNVCHVYRSFLIITERMDLDLT